MRYAFPILIAALVLVAVACGSSPTVNPVSVDVVSTPAPTPPPPRSPSFDVSGTWTGSVSYSYPDDWCACCNPNASRASATFTQSGSQVGGQIHSACFDEEFAGTLQDGQLRGTARVTDGSVIYNGQAAGPATSDRFYLGTDHLKRDGGQEVSGYRITFSR